MVKVLQVRRVQQDLQVLLVQLALEPLVLLVLVGLQAQLVLLESLDLQEWVLLEQQVLRGQQVTQAQLDR